MIAVRGVSGRIVVGVLEMRRRAPRGMGSLADTGRAVRAAAAGTSRGRGARGGAGVGAFGTPGIGPLARAAALGRAALVGTPAAHRIGTTPATSSAAGAGRSVLRPGRRGIGSTRATRRGRVGMRPPGCALGRARLRRPGARRRPHGRTRVLLLGHRDPRTAAARAGYGAVEVSSTRLAVVHRDCPEFCLKKLRSNRILPSRSPDFQRPAVSARQKPRKMRAR